MQTSPAIVLRRDRSRQGPADDLTGATGGSSRVVPEPSGNVQRPDGPTPSQAPLQRMTIANRVTRERKVPLPRPEFTQRGSGVHDGWDAGNYGGSCGNRMASDLRHGLEPV